MIFSSCRPWGGNGGASSAAQSTQHTRTGAGHGEHLNEADLGPPLLDIIMEQGDALYVP